MEVGLFENAAGVGANGALGHEQRFGNDPGRAAAGQVGQYFCLAPGEAVIASQQLEQPFLVDCYLFVRGIGGRGGAGAGRDGLRF